MKKKSGEVIKFYGAMWCGDCRRAKAFLDQNNIKYSFTNTDTDQKAIEFVEKINHGNRSIPTIIFPDGSVLVEPSNQELAQKTWDKQ